VSICTPVEVGDPTIDRFSALLRPGSPGVRRVWTYIGIPIRKSGSEDCEAVSYFYLTKMDGRVFFGRLF
jgi:hypothetical protein